MDSAAWLAGDDPIVGIVDAETDATGPQSGGEGVEAVEAIAAALDDREAELVTGAAEDVLSARPSLLVTIGERALTTIARTEPDVPVLPAGTVPGIEAVDRTDLDAAIAAALDGEAIERPRPVLGVELASRSATARDRALFDVTLVTAEPARISEYAITSRDDPIARFRADGVVVATAAGSHGYARAVDAPQLSPAVDAVAVSPIAPFVTDTRRWVLPDDDVVLTVERDEGDVRLLADDRAVGTVAADASVSVGVDGTLSTLVVSGNERDS
ncbi:NAD(+)/NADH kinase [Halosolutus gelatinilyticus]|uniref:NAD(+)/NADH kinase n=1 Tax=Halosolutus gelatinilyticus TaxID=2931975 RepID=UPI001FF5495D|nr:NAD(+)/NADH kinase [Halosolutus gelatinilyticus]